MTVAGEIYAELLAEREANRLAEYRVEILRQFQGYGTAYTWEAETETLRLTKRLDIYQAQALAATAYCVRFAFARVTRIK